MVFVVMVVCVVMSGGLAVVVRMVFVVVGFVYRMVFLAVRCLCRVKPACGHGG